MPEPRKFEASCKIWNGSELGTEQYFGVGTYNNIRTKWGVKNAGPKVQLAMAKLLAAHKLRAKGLPERRCESSCSRPGANGWQRATP